MKKIFIVSFLVLALFTGCEQGVFNTKKVHVIIPEHPWETGSDIRLWYNLKWNDNGKIKTVYIDRYTRELDIKIPVNTTVYICAYPLGEMLPFGAAITPLQNTGEVVLNQYDGYVAHLLINTNPEAAGRVNYEVLIGQIRARTDDARMIDDSQLLSDLLNGRLGQDSVVIKKKFSIEEISIPDGKWVSECEYDGYLYAENGHAGPLTLSAGVFRYYCEDLDREFRVVVDNNGGVFHTLRYGMIGL